MFFECANCGVIYLFPLMPSADSGVKCEKCYKDKFIEKSNKFILQCPVCLEYWSRRVVRIILEKGICHCLTPKCDGVLKIRSQINETSVIAGKAVVASESDNKSVETSSEIVEEKQAEKEAEEKKKPKKHKKEPKSSEIDTPKEELKEKIKPSSKSESKIPPPDEIKPVGLKAHFSIPKTSIDKVEEILDKSVEDEDKELIDILEEQPKIPSSKLSAPTIEINQDFASILLDPLTLEPRLDQDGLLQLMESILCCTDPSHLLNLGQIEDILVTTTLAMDMKSNCCVEEAVDFAYYVGDINGDFNLLRLLVQYFRAIIKPYPMTKIVFLGNYFGHGNFDLETLLLVYLFYLNYPDNVVLLRGCAEFKEKAEDLKFWQRLLDRFSSEHQDTVSLNLILRYILFTFGRLPLIHIATMNKGQICVYSSHSGIPILTETPDQPCKLQDCYGQFQFGTELWSKVDSLSRQILLGIPDETLGAVSVDITNLDYPRFGKDLFRKFLEINKCNYMVRSHQEQPNGVQFTFNSFVCSVFTTSKYDIPSLKQFKPKIIRLVPGYPLGIFDCTLETLQKDLKDKFKIDTELKP